jgi:hypothetical protein
MQRAMRLAATFGFGFFVTLGVLALANVMANWPRTIEFSAVLALLGGLAALAAGVVTGDDRRRAP